MKQSKIWKVTAVDEKLQEDFSASLGVSKTLSGILIRRGFEDIASAKEFLNVDREECYDAMLLKDMDVAIARIRRAIDCQEKIVIYGDYDVDGITSTSLLFKALVSCGAIVDFYIPEREKEGYGLNCEALEKIIENGASLIVTVDCGISAAEEVKCFNKQIDIIITDHHLAPDIVPEALAIINPKQSDCLYPAKGLAGVGVVYKLVCALCQAYGISEPPDSMEIVTLGTVADVVPLLGENRIFVKRGLRQINKSSNIGIKALLDVCGLAEKNIDTGHVGFLLAPRLNAAGRLGSAKTAVELLITSEALYAKSLAEKLNTENEQRQLIEREILAKAEAYIDTLDLATEKVLVVAGDGWNAGVIGIVASKLIERYYRPTVVLSVQGDMAKGSCRSIAGFNIYEALKKCEDILETYGGHSQAAGLSILPANIEALHQRLSALAADILTEEDYIPIVEIDAVLEAAEISEDLVEELSCMEPYGMKNSRPIFMVSAVNLLEARSMGRDDAHLRFRASKESCQFSGIAWRRGDLAVELNNERKIDLVFQPEINEWQGSRFVQLKALDFRTYEKEVTDIDRLFMAAELDAYSDIAKAEQFFTKAVGVSFDQRQSVIENLAAGDKLVLKRYPDNIYDVNAIAIETLAGASVGFIRAQIAAKLAPHMDQYGTEYDVSVTDVTGGAGRHFGVNLLVCKVVQRLFCERKYTSITLEEVRQVLLGEHEYHQAQLDALEMLENGKNTFVIMGTGRGKSAIFQTQAALTAINMHKMTIIVYPLRALVNDQYVNLKNKFAQLGISVYKGNGTLSMNERAVLFEAMIHHEVDVLLTTPEFLTANIKSLRLAEQQIGFFVVDECHHIAKDSNRLSYKNINQLRYKLGNPLTLAVTATAGNEDAAIITEALQIDTMVVDKTVRENLVIYDGRSTVDKLKYINRLINKGEKILIFVNSRKKAVEIAATLRESHPSLSEKIGFYHAGLSNEWRVKVENWFKGSTLQIVVATSAFGEGVDIPDIRHVIQYHMPFDLTSFNQQCGRAGRDGRESLIHLLFGQDDIKLNALILKERAPQREVIGKIYLILKNAKGAEDGIVMTNAEIAQLCMDKYREFIGESGVSASLKILEELKLISRENFSGSRTIFFHGVPQGKMDLIQSAAYVEGCNERNAFEKFADDALYIVKEKLLDFINRPIYPEN